MHHNCEMSQNAYLLASLVLSYYMNIYHSFALKSHSTGHAFPDKHSPGSTLNWFLVHQRSSQASCRREGNFVIHIFSNL